MFCKINLIKLICLFFAISNQLFAAESKPDEFQQAEVVMENSTDLVDTQALQEPDAVPSPLLTEQEAHGQLVLSSYDPGHNLFPVRIISIDDWSVTEQMYGKKILLAKGEHRLKVLPDFSNIYPKKVFMNNPWPEKHITFSLKDKQQIAVAARLMEEQQNSWEVQMFLVNFPEAEPESPNIPSSNPTNQ